MPGSRTNTHDNDRRYRERMRAKGLRQIQLWVPGTRSPAFAAECRRQSLLVAADPAEELIMDELEALQDPEGWRA
ncbi:MAG: antitoxin MazE family protein [Geminicoccaceae bacterium]